VLNKSEHECINIRNLYRFIMNNEEYKYKDIVKQKLLVTSEKIFEEIVNKASNFLIIDDNGSVHLKIPLTKLTQQQGIWLFLVGKYLAKMGKIIHDENASIAEIAHFLNSYEKRVRSRLSELKQAGLVEPTKRGYYRIVYARIPTLLDSLITKEEF